MNTTAIANKASRAFYKVAFKFKKHSPEILVVAGVAGLVTSGVMACKATTKLSILTEKHKENVEAIHSALENPDRFEEGYTEKDSQKDLAIVYRDTAFGLIKLYGPSVALATASTVAIFGGHNILHKRNVALGAAYAAVDKSFKEYRGRVVERFGDALDKELRYNIKAKDIEEVIVNEDGTETTVTKTGQVVDPNSIGDFARFFDDGCSGWDKNPEFSLTFLKNQQNYANEKLKAQGYLFINDVYEMLGIPKCSGGQVVGWIYDEKNPIGDNFVDFGIYDLYNEKKRDFVNGYERVILLDFNHDGNILRYI